MWVGETVDAKFTVNSSVRVARMPVFTTDDNETFIISSTDNDEMV